MRQLEYVCVDGTATKHSDWRLEFGEDKRSRRHGARLNKKSVRKRRLTSNAKFSLKNWKWQVLRKYEMPKECWHATIQKHWNKSVSLINASLVCWQHLCRPAGVLLNLKLPFLFDFKSNRGWKGTLSHWDRPLFLVEGPFQRISCLHFFDLGH